MSMEIYGAKMIWDTIMQRRVVIVWGREFLTKVRASDGDVERLNMNDHPDYRVRCDMIVTTYNSDGTSSTWRQALDRVNHRYPGPDPDWAACYVMKWAVPVSIGIGDLSKASIELTSNMGEKAEWVDLAFCSIPSRTAFDVLTHPVTVDKKNPLVGKILDLRLFRGKDKPAITIASEECVIEDVEILYPQGPAFHALRDYVGCSIQRVRAKCYMASTIEGQSSTGNVFNELEFQGWPGMRAGQFGLLFSGGRNLHHQVGIRNFSRGPIWFPTGAELARDCTIGLILERIIPSNGESEGMVREHSQCEYPEDVLAAVPGGDSTILRVVMKSGMADNLARVGSHVCDMAGKAWARITEAKAARQKGVYFLTLDRGLADLRPGNVRVGPLSVENLLTHSMAYESKSLLTLAGPSADNNIIDCNASGCLEPIEAFRTPAIPGPVPRTDYPGAFNEVFQWRTEVAFSSAQGCNRQAVVHNGNRTMAPNSEGIGWAAAGGGRERIHGIGWVNPKT